MNERDRLAERISKVLKDDLTVDALEEVIADFILKARPEEKRVQFEYFRDHDAEIANITIDQWTAVLLGKEEL